MANWPTFPAFTPLTQPTGATSGMPDEEYPVIAKPTDGDPDSGIKNILQWTQESLPDIWSYWQNNSQNAIMDAEQLSREAIDSKNARMNEMSGVYNQYYPYMQDVAATASGLYGDATSAVQDYSNLGLGTLEDWAQKADLSELMSYVENGSIPQSVDDTLRQILTNQQASAERSITDTTNDTLGALIQHMGSSGMMDSSYTGQAMGNVARETSGAIGDVNRELENDYLKSRLEYPFKQLEAGVASLAGYEPLANLAQAQSATGQNLSTALGNEAGQGFQMGNTNFNSAMDNLYRISQMPDEYLTMIQELPKWGSTEAGGAMTDIQNIWANYLNYELGKESNANNAPEEPSFWDILF